MPHAAFGFTGFPTKVGDLGLSFPLDFGMETATIISMARVVLENASKMFSGSNGESIQAVNRANLSIGDKE